MPAHMMLSIGKWTKMVYRIMLPLTLLSVYCLFYYVIWFDFMLINVMHICLPISAHGLWKWLMILTLVDQLTYLNVLHSIERLYYYGFFANEGIGLILGIHTFYPSIQSVLYNKDVYPTSSIVWSTIFPFNILKSH